MLTILKILWNNTLLVMYHEFSISKGSNSYDYKIRIIANVIVLLFFFLVLFEFFVGFYFVFDSMKEIKTKTVILLCLFSPLMFSGLFCWYIYVLIAIKKIKKYTKLLRNSGLKTCDRRKYEEGN